MKPKIPHANVTTFHEVKQQQQQQQQQTKNKQTKIFYIVVCECCTDFIVKIIKKKNVEQSNKGIRAQQKI